MRLTTANTITAITLGCQALDDVVADLERNADLHSNPILRSQLGAALETIAQCLRCIGDAVEALDVEVELGSVAPMIPNPPTPPSGHTVFDVLMSRLRPDRVRRTGLASIRSPFDVRSVSGDAAGDDEFPLTGIDMEPTSRLLTMTDPPQEDRP